MSKYVVYVSKSGNTKFIAEKIAEVVGCKLIPLNLIEKQGKGTTGERAQEEAQFLSALKKCKDAELVFVGTPVIAKQPHSLIAKFVNTAEAKRMAFFITYQNTIGFTLKELKDTAEIRSIRFLGEIEYSGLKSGAINELGESDKQDMLKKAEKFAKDCLQAIK